MMVTDFYKKPLQGASFRLFRSMILNLDDPDLSNYSKQSNLTQSKKSVKLQECAEEYHKYTEKVNKVRFKKDIESTDKKPTYADIVSSRNSIMSNDTRGIIKTKNPTLLRKLTDLATEHYAT